MEISEVQLSLHHPQGCNRRKQHTTFALRAPPPRKVFILTQGQLGCSDGDRAGLSAPLAGCWEGLQGKEHWELEYLRLHPNLPAHRGRFHALRCLWQAVRQHLGFSLSPPNRDELLKDDGKQWHRGHLQCLAVL